MGTERCRTGAVGGHRFLLFFFLLDAFFLKSLTQLNLKKASCPELDCLYTKTVISLFIHSKHKRKCIDVTLNSKEGLYDVTLKILRSSICVRCWWVFNVSLYSNHMIQKGSHSAIFGTETPRSALAVRLPWHSSQLFSCLFSSHLLLLSALPSDGLAAFRAFLRTEFSEENLEFWLACEEYKKIKSQSKMASKAKKIFAEYIAIQSCKEVSDSEYSLCGYWKEMVSKQPLAKKPKTCILHPLKDQCNPAFPSPF